MSLPATVVESLEGLPSLTVCNRHGRARIYLQGAHVAAFRPVGEGELLWTSVRSWFIPGKPIRGGIPVCFPWFGPHPQDGQQPPHGFARLRPFALAGAEELPDGRTRVLLALEDDAETRAVWPQRFGLSCAITVGAALEVTVTVTNRGDQPFSFEEALHTYLDVGDVRRARVHGLGGVRFLDKVEGGTVRQEGAAPIAFTGETDRVYQETTGACELEDPVLGRRLRVEKTGSRSTVVWNPWSAKAARMPDFGDEEWSGMACIETANVGDARVTLAPGASHEMRLRLGVAR